MRRALFVAILVACMPLAAQTHSVGDGGILVWPKGVPAQGTTHKDDFGNHILSISHRESNGRVEIHQTKADVMIVQSGEADLLSGGEIENPVVTGPNELQGPSMKGGVRQHVGAGDVIHIPTGVAHQFFVPPGGQITYMVVKVVDPATKYERGTEQK